MIVMENSIRVDSFGLISKHVHIWIYSEKCTGHKNIPRIVETFLGVICMNVVCSR